MRRAFLPQTLLWRIGLVLMGTQLAILLALGWVGLAGVREFQYAHVRQELQRIEPVLADSYRAASALSLTDLDAMVKEDGGATGLRITLILLDGTVIADSEVDPAELENHRYGRAEIEAALTEGEGFAIRYSNTLKQEMIYFGRRSAWHADDEIMVRVSLPLTQVDQELSHLRRLGLTAGAVSILLTMLVVYLVSRRFSQQVETLADAAARFSDGELDYEVALPSARELARLAISLNGMGRQLSERVAELQKQQVEQRAILESMSNGVIALDREHHVLNLNRAAEDLLGVSSKQARGRLLQELARYPLLSELVASLVAGQATGTIEIEIDTEVDGRRIIEVRGETLNSPDDPKGGVLLLLNDVTERHRFESLRSDFAANVSHELRTPITNIKGYAETLQEVGFEDVEQAERFLGIIRSNSDRLAAIVEDVLSLTNLEQAHVRETLDFEPVLTSWLLESVAEQFADAARNKSIRIIVETDEDQPIVAHPRLLLQAIGNLVSNAVRYSSEGAEIVLHTQQMNGELEIQVIDDGPGIPAEHFPRLFERFYRVDKARSRQLGGTGLGLAIVKYIAGVHGGRVGVSSLVGEGSTFSIILPRTDADSSIS